jgi:hypothetical protein
MRVYPAGIATVNHRSDGIDFWAGRAAGPLGAVLIGLFLAAGCGPSHRAPETSAPLGSAPAVEPARPVSSGALTTGSPPPAAPWFVDRTSAAGIDFTYHNGAEAGHCAILESLGGGVAMLDYDLDGREDLYFPGGGGFGPEQQITGRAGALYRQIGPWRFGDVTAPARSQAARYYTHGVARGDYDADGFPDLLLTGYGGVQLLRNLGDGTFADATDEAGLADPLWSSVAGWGDLNGDGDLDLFVVHYVNWSFANHPFCPGPRPGVRDVCPPREFQALPDRLFLSRGEGTFREVSAEVGLREDGKGLGLVLADLDLDGDLDVYVANDTVANHLYRNDGAAGWTDVSLLSGASVSDRGFPDGSMGTAIVDSDADGLPDLWVVNYERETNALYRNQGGLLFQHASGPTGISAVGGMYVGWGTCGFDFDLDGDEDLFVSNGHVIYFPSAAPVQQRPLLFRNDGGSRFVNVAAEAGGYLAEAHEGRGVACGDLDGDGRVDLVISRNNQPVVVLANDVDAGGHWLCVQLIGTRSARDAVGTTVRVTTARGSQVRQWSGGGSYASTHARPLHFGLGDTDLIEELEVRWPSGERQVISHLRGDAHWVVVEPASAGDPGWCGEVAHPSPHW